MLDEFNIKYIVNITKLKYYIMYSWNISNINKCNVPTIISIQDEPILVFSPIQVPHKLFYNCKITIYKYTTYPINIIN